MKELFGDLAVEQEEERAKERAAQIPCRSGCGWAYGFPHDKDCPGTAGRQKQK